MNYGVIGASGCHNSVFLPHKVATYHETELSMPCYYLLINTFIESYFVVTLS